MKKLFILLVLSGLPFVIFSQGDIEGNVHCMNGSPIAGAVVSLGSYADTTNFAGNFLIEDIPAGFYDLEVTITGYPAMPTIGVMIEDGQTLQADIPVPCGDLSVTPENLEVILEPMEVVAETVTLTNSGSGPVNWSAQINDLTGSVSDELFDLMYEIPLNESDFECAIESDGNYIYTANNYIGTIRKYDLNGNLIDSFTLPGIGGIYELTWDGTYFYGTTATTLVHVLDFDQQQVVGTIDTYESVKAIAYDEDMNVFYGYNNDIYITVFDHEGNLIATLSIWPDTGPITGLAYDNVTEGGPYLWIYGKVDDDFHTLTQYKLPDCYTTGVSANLEEILTAPVGNMPGGLFTTKNMQPGVFAFGGIVKSELLWVLELSEYDHWLSVEPWYGTLAAGESQDVEVTFDATDVYPWHYKADIEFSTLPDVGDETVFAEMWIVGMPGVDMLSAAVSCTDVMLTWETIPPGSPADSFHVYRDGDWYATVFDTQFTDEMMMPGSSHNYKTSAYFFNGWESDKTNQAFAEVPYPEFTDPANLAYTNPADSIVCLSWENNACLEPDYYMVYRGLLLIDMVTEPYYCDTLEYPGDYYYYVSSEFYFGSGWSEMVYYTWDPVNVPEINNPAFSVFPNPATDFVFLRHPELPETVTLYNAMGEKVLFVSNPKTNRFDVSSFECGIYFLVAEFENMKQNTRLIIQ